MEQLDGARKALEVLAQRLRSRDEVATEEDQGLTALIDVVNDTGRALACRAEQDLAETLPFMAAFREVLETGYGYEALHKVPFECLSDEKVAKAYAAGAMWAASSIIYAALGRWDAETDERRQRSARADVRSLVLRLLDEHGRVRPRDVLESARTAGAPIDKSVVSRVLSDLLATGRIEQAGVSEGDRRSRHYQYAEQGGQIPPAVLESFTQASHELASWCDDDEEVADALRRALA